MYVLPQHFLIVLCRLVSQQRHLYCNFGLRNHEKTKTGFGYGNFWRTFLPAFNPFRDLCVARILPGVLDVPGGNACGSCVGRLVS